MPSVRSLLPLGSLTAALLLGCAGCAASTSSSVDPEPADAAPHAAPAAPVAPAASATDRADTVVTIGDSIMAGYGLDPDDAWPALLADTTGTTVVNLGCSGAGFIAVGDCGTDFEGLIGLAAEVHPDLVIVQSSDNDLDQEEDDIDAATTATIAALREAVPTARIVGVNTLWSPSDDEPDSIDWSTQALRAAVTAVGGDFVSIGQPLRGEEDLLQWDEEHPSVRGQVVLRAAIQHAFAVAGIPL